MDPQDAVKAFSGIICSYGRQTCLDAVAEALKEVIGPVTPKLKLKTKGRRRKQ
jgi:hypothetical protein